MGGEERFIVSRKLKELLTKTMLVSLAIADVQLLFCCYASSIRDIAIIIVKHFHLIGTLCKMQKLMYQKIQEKGK